MIDVTRKDESLQSTAERKAGRRVERIALDPGHGGSDPGATGEHRHGTITSALLIDRD